VIKRSVLAAAIAMFVTGSNTLHAQTTVLDFEEVPCGAGGLPVLLSTYSFAGFKISSVPAIRPPSTVGLGVWCPGQGSNIAFAGSKALFVNTFESSITTLVRGDGGAFGITSVKLANILGDIRGGPISFLGTQTDGTVVSQLFTVPINNTPVLNLFTFSTAFARVTSLQWTTGSSDALCTSTNNTGICVNGGRANVQLDDFTLNTTAQDRTSTVPEPSTYALMAAGLLGIGLVRKRRSRLA